jgi:hypothetical protein
MSRNGFTREEIERAAQACGVTVQLDREPGRDEPYGRQGWMRAGGILSEVCPETGERLYDLEATAEALSRMEDELLYDGYLGAMEDARNALRAIEKLQAALEREAREA